MTLRWETRSFTGAPTGVSAVTVAGIVVIAGCVCKQATLAALLIYMVSRGGGVGMNHPRDREDTVEDVSLNLNAAFYQMPLMPSQVWLILQYYNS